MSGLAVRAARFPEDVPEVLGILNTAAARLHHAGEDQWWYGFGPEPRIIGPIKAGRTLLAVPVDESLAVATVTVCPDGDPDFWTPAELTTPAWYVAKWATAQWAPKGTGGLLLRWVVDQAHQAGIGVVRADVWRTNQGLQDLYRRSGWAWLRTEVVTRGDGTLRNSGALFERASGEDLTARAAFAGRPGWQARAIRDALPEGQRVRVVKTGAEGEVLHVRLPDVGQPAHGPGTEYPVRTYLVRLDSGALVPCDDMDVEPILQKLHN
jgi:GNAT superfamily N-acetyltransferase